MRNAVKFAITLLVGVSLFYFVVKETGIEAIWEGIILFLRPEGLIIIATTFLIVFIGALRWREVIASQGKRVPLLLTIRYLVKGFTVDFLTPFSLFGGEAVRIFLMEKSLGLKKSATAAAIDKIMDVTMHFFFLVLGIVLFIIHGSEPSGVFLYYAGGVITALFFILFLFYQFALRKKSMIGWVFKIFGFSKNYLADNGNGKMVMEIERGIIRFFSFQRKELLKGMALSFLRHLLLAFRVYIILFFLVGQTELGHAFAVYGLTILSMLLPLPAALGGMEAIMALGFGTLGIGLTAGVAYAVTVRSADLIVCALGIILFIRLSFTSFLKQFNLFIKNFSTEKE